MIESKIFAHVKVLNNLPEDILIWFDILKLHHMNMSCYINYPEDIHPIDKFYYEIRLNMPLPLNFQKMVIHVLYDNSHREFRFLEILENGRKGYGFTRHIRVNNPYTAFLLTHRYHKIESMKAMK